MSAQGGHRPPLQKADASKQILKAGSGAERIPCRIHFQSDNLDVALPVTGGDWRNTLPNLVDGT